MCLKSTLFEGWLKNEARKSKDNFRRLLGVQWMCHFGWDNSHKSAKHRRALQNTRKQQKTHRGKLADLVNRTYKSKQATNFWNLEWKVLPRETNLHFDLAAESSLARRQIQHGRGDVHAKAVRVLQKVSQRRVHFRYYILARVQSDRESKRVHRPVQ